MSKVELDLEDAIELLRGYESTFNKLVGDVSSGVIKRTVQMKNLSEAIYKAERENKNPEEKRKKVYTVAYITYKNTKDEKWDRCFYAHSNDEALFQIKEFIAFLGLAGKVESAFVEHDQRLEIWRINSEEDNWCKAQTQPDKIVLDDRICIEERINKIESGIDCLIQNINTQNAIDHERISKLEAFNKKFERKG